MRAPVRNNPYHEIIQSKVEDLQALARRIRFANILYLTDFSPASENALPFALAIARHYASKLHILHVVTPEPYICYPPESVISVLDALTDSAKKCMQDLSSSGLFTDVRCNPMIKTGELWDTISEVVKKNDIELIVVGTRGRSGVSKFLLGSVAEQVFRSAECPVLTVGPHGMERSTHQEFQRILLGIDFSPGCADAMHYAISLAQEFQSHLLVVHAIPEIQSDQLAKDLESEFYKHQLRRFLPEEALPWCNVEYMVAFGHPADVILEIAKDRRAELVVMGVKGAGAMEGVSTHFGSTATRVVCEVHCPVLSVRSQEQQ